MKVNHIPSGPPANESESKAISHLINQIKSQPDDSEWILLTNLMFSVNPQQQSDELDIVVIGPPGVKLLEVKHWNTRWIEKNYDTVKREADRLTFKARKIGTTLRRSIPGLVHVEGAFLITGESLDDHKLRSLPVGGVSFHKLSEWKLAVNMNNPKTLDDVQVRCCSKILQPSAGVYLDGGLRRLGGIVNLELLTPKEERFHRVYKGIQAIRKDRVILHLYDLSASSDKNAEKKARREFDALHALQQYRWTPRILDSFQESPGFAGEMFFFSMVDPAAPTLEERKTDSSWNTKQRIEFAKNVILALSEMHGHQFEDGASPIIHRNLTPQTLLVRHDNTPIITGFHLMRIPSEYSISSAVSSSEWKSTAAPEIIESGLAAADQRSDIYSVCASLQTAFACRSDMDSLRCSELLTTGMTNNPQNRPLLYVLKTEMAGILGESMPTPVAPPARFWSEDLVIRFRDKDYRIVSRLGSGGVGSTFKVIEMDRTKEDLGAYVAKAVHTQEQGQDAIKAYSLVRSHLGRQAGLSAIYEVAKEWENNNFVALMTWIEGSSLSDYIGLFPLLAEDLQEDSAENLAIRWICQICESLETIHKVRLVHGDVSPRNIIVSNGGVVLTDYDFVTRIDDIVTKSATMMYCTPSSQEKIQVAPSDDIYALAASFFHVLFDKEPFWFNGNRIKENGLNWDGIEKNIYTRIAGFLDKATHPDRDQRYRSATEVIADLQVCRVAEDDRTQSETQSDQTADVLEENTSIVLGKQSIAWLQSLLQSYPGGRWGNSETRGLDTDFAAKTYVETGLERILLEEIQTGKARLVILCGNAGDGKTALLQYLAKQLDFGMHQSSERIIEDTIDKGIRVRMNLDGSASWKGKSSDDILDEFLKPFQKDRPSKKIVHLLAINDGRLLEWIEHAENLNDGNQTPLTRILSDFLMEEGFHSRDYIRFISLNQRSLVGGLTPDNTSIETRFLHHLIDQLYGGDEAETLWEPCKRCESQKKCNVYISLQVFAPKNIPSSVSNEVRNRARERLFESLQAVHLRGEVHITARELRAAMIFILFGLHSCEDYHNNIDSQPVPYWDLAFDSLAPGRQGDVLRELVRFDPSLEAHPQIDRYLQSKPGFEDKRSARRWPNLRLESARRRAYFEWTEPELLEIAGDKESLGLASGRHLRLFRDISLKTASSKHDLCLKVCRGISRLEDLPSQALDRLGIVSLRITPRTPTESVFWIEKPVDRFRLEPQLVRAMEGVEQLHRGASLIYRYRDNREEKLLMGADLFHLLLELNEGYQLGDVSSDDTFAHLSIFIQRLARENESELLAWNPMQDQTIFRVAAVIMQQANGPVQKLILTTNDKG